MRLVRSILSGPCKTERHEGMAERNKAADLLMTRKTEMRKRKGPGPRHSLQRHVHKWPISQGGPPSTMPSPSNSYSILNPSVGEALMFNLSGNAHRHTQRCALPLSLVLLGLVK
jgi:hypothetical protein